MFDKKMNVGFSCEEIIHESDRFPQTGGNRV